MHYASQAYKKAALETANPRELEASLLLQAAAKLQEVRDSWGDKPAGLNDAVTFNRKLWTILIDAVMKDENRLPIEVRSNLTRLGMYVMSETFALMTKPTPSNLEAIIKVNRSIAAGLRAKN